MVSRLRASLEQSPQARRFVVYGDGHPPLEELNSESPGAPVSVYGSTVTDTCKAVAGGLVQRTVPRESLFVAGGPWVFTREALGDGLSRVAGREAQIAGLVEFCRLARLAVRTLAR